MSCKIPLLSGLWWSADLSLDPPRKGKKYLSYFVLAREISQMEGKIPWSVSKISQQRRKRLFSLEIFKLNKYSCLEEGSLIRIQIC